MPLSNLADPRHRDPGPSLHQPGGVARDRPAGDRARQGRLRLRHRRQALHRGHGRAVVHGARLRQRGAGRGRGGADAQARLRHLFTGKSHDPAIELAEKLKEMAPVPISKVFFCNSGSEANDTQIKLVWYMNNALGRPDKKKIISRLKGYHGVTIARRLAHRPAAQPRGFRPADRRHPAHVGCPHHYRFAQDGESEEEFATRLAAELEETDPARGARHGRRLHRRAGDGRGRRDRAAEDLFREDQAVCEKYDIYMICRRGDLRLRPARRASSAARRSASSRHSISVAKALILGLPADRRRDGARRRCTRRCSTESRKIGAFGHGFTYSGHPVAAAVAVKTLEIYARDRIFEAAARASPQFQQRLEALGEHPLVGEARGLGLIGAVELVADKATKRSFDPKPGVGAAVVALRRGRRADRARGRRATVISVCPPLIIRAGRDRRAVRRGSAARSTGRSTGRSASSCWPAQAATGPTARPAGTSGVKDDPAQASCALIFAVHFLEACTIC